MMKNFTIIRGLKQISLSVLALSFFLLFKSSLIFAQTWPMPGANWQYCMLDWTGSPAGYVELSYTGDTLIENIAYNIIQVVDAKMEESNFVLNPKSIFTRYANDTVFRYVNDRDYLFFTFNINLGSTYSTFRSTGAGVNWSDSACISTMNLLVVDSGSVTYGGHTFQKLVLRDTAFTSLYWNNYLDSVDYTLIERIGVTNAFPFINTHEPTGSCEIPSDFSTVIGLGRYSDNEFEYHFFECEGVGIKEKQTTNCSYSIFPNPAENQITIEISQLSSNSLTIEIVDELGRTVKTNIICDKETTINIDDLLPGIYYCRVSGDRIFNVEKFIKH